MQQSSAKGVVPAHCAISPSGVPQSLLAGLLSDAGGGGGHAEISGGATIGAGEMLGENRRGGAAKAARR